ncbi:MAG: hypothetical protein L0Y74_08410, partial [candidate division Zixibacteria bacterium]|nr:hypothetical protein [candidate division Zixibacteria bacterium]
MPKTVTANFKAKAKIAYGTQPVILAKIYYGTAGSFLLCSTREVKIGSDVYKPYVINFGAIVQEISEAPGLGLQSNCTIRLNRKIFYGGTQESVAQNLLTQASKGKKVQLWQFFDDDLTPVLTDSDKCPLPSLIIQDANPVAHGEIELKCVAKEMPIANNIPALKFTLAGHPDLMQGNIGLTKPVLFGDFHYSDSSNPHLEYLWCNKPPFPPTPAFLIDIFENKYLVHEAGHPAKRVTGELEFFQWLSDWKVYAFCKEITTRVWTESAVGNSNVVDLNVYNGASGH